MAGILGTAISALPPVTNVLWVIIAVILLVSKLIKRYKEKEENEEEISGVPALVIVLLSLLILLAPGEEIFKLFGNLAPVVAIPLALGCVVVLTQLVYMLIVIGIESIRKLVGK